jgi:outer membrane immunogenic protein
MHRSFIAGAAAVAVAVAAAPSLAQDGSFTGFSIGAQGGWQGDRLSGTGRVVVPGTGETPTPGISIFDVRENGSGFAGGIFIGYDGEVGSSVVLGGELGVNWGGGSIDINPFGPRSEITPKRTIDLTARGGVLVTPQSLLYVRGGYSNARYTLRLGDAGLSENRDGWTLGGGFEQSFGNNVSGRVEYRYSDYGRDTAVDGGSTFEGKLSRNQVMAGIAYRW